MKLPKARTRDLLEQDLNGEILIYDLLVDNAFNLNETLSVVYRACDGITTFDDLKRRHKFTDDFIFLALDELKRHNLLTEAYQSAFGTIKRREAIKRVGLATMAALPMIVAITAPSAASAQSRNVALGGSCTTSSQCVRTASNCSSNRCCTGTAPEAGVTTSNNPIFGCSGFVECPTFQGDCDSSAAMYCCSGQATYRCSGSGDNTSCICNCVPV